MFKGMVRLNVLRYGSAQGVKIGYSWAQRIQKGKCITIVRLKVIRQGIVQLNV